MGLQRGPEPLYRQLAASLRASIRAGDYPPGSQLPSLKELMADYNVADGTARKAVRLLADEGLVAVTPGLGTFVKEQQ